MLRQQFGTAFGDLGKLLDQGTGDLVVVALPVRADTSLMSLPAVRETLPLAPPLALPVTRLPPP